MNQYISTIVIPEGFIEQQYSYMNSTEFIGVGVVRYLRHHKICPCCRNADVIDKWVYYICKKCGGQFDTYIVSKQNNNKVNQLNLF